MNNLFAFMWNTALMLGALAAGYWFLRGQSIHKGFGFTFHWSALLDLLAGLLITTIAMVGIFLVLLAIGSISVVSVQVNTAALGQEAYSMLLGAPFEEIVSRALQQSGTQVLIGLVLALLLQGRLGGTWESRMDKTTVWAVWPAILVISLLFGYIHIRNDNATWFTAFGNALGGLMYGIAFAGGKNIWLPIGMHYAWNFVQGPVLGFAVSGGQRASIITLQHHGPALLTGGEFGPEGGLVGMVFRFVVIGMVLYYLYLRAGRRGDIARLEFPIKVYANPPRPRPSAVNDQKPASAGA